MTKCHSLNNRSVFCRLGVRDQGVSRAGFPAAPPLVLQMASRLLPERARGRPSVGEQPCVSLCAHISFCKDTCWIGSGPAAAQTALPAADSDASTWTSGMHRRSNVSKPELTNSPDLALLILVDDNFFLPSGLNRPEYCSFAGSVGESPACLSSKKWRGCGNSGTDTWDSMVPADLGLGLALSPRHLQKQAGGLVGAR